MADQGGAPVWARARKSRGNPLVNVITVVLALFGALSLILAGVDHSFSRGGARLDGWIGSISAKITGAKAKVTAMDQSAPVEPASAPAAAKVAAAAPTAGERKP